MSFDDSVDAIDAATIDGRLTGHDLAGFSRRVGTFGYRFVSRCRRCGHVIIVGRASRGWDYPSPPPLCSSDERVTSDDGLGAA